MSLHVGEDPVQFGWKPSFSCQHRMRATALWVFTAACGAAKLRGG
jgi:hypothetical protein